MRRDLELPLGTHYKYLTVSNLIRFVCLCVLSSPQFHNLQELRHSASLANKVFIQRDYSEGTTCKFQTKFPSELESRVSRRQHSATRAFKDSYM